uniref:Uncharacterized protein n=1 Tax=uncultured marine virus TaxID=186617 RepID=S4TF65_9VIRU|nr:hypothetical protein [uncultured marine virus]
MARTKTPTIQPAITSLNYEMPTSTVGVTRYIDLAADLSKLNRKLFRQGYQYAIAGITVTDDVGVLSACEITVNTAGNSWITQNAWTKGYALWNQMNEEVLDDNPSIQGKWADYKVYLNENMAGANTIQALDGNMVAWPAGAEWEYSRYVVPQHDVSLVDGSVLPALEYVAALVGPDDLPNFRFSLVKAYEESRATVQDIAPNVPVALPNSFYLQLTDDGSQDPELATVIQDANDQPPYPMAPGEYPGSEAFGFAGASTRVARGVKNDFAPTMTLPGFTAECGLLQIGARRSEGAENIRLQIHLVPGSYRGIMAKPMGQ